MKGGNFLVLFKKDFKLMLASKFHLLALGSLILYSLYIQFIYIHIDQSIYPVYLYDPLDTLKVIPPELTSIEYFEEFQSKIHDGYAIGIDATSQIPQILMTSSNVATTDHLRVSYANFSLSFSSSKEASVIGENTKEMKNRREITCEFLFFELTAVGFLGIAAILFKERQMGVVRVHGVLPVSKNAFILSKLSLFLLVDLLFASSLTMINLGFSAGLAVLPFVFIQTSILSIIMALTGFYCAVVLADFKQFSLLYLVLAIFVTTPVFLVGQIGLEWAWIKYHPMYHLFMAMKNAYFNTPSENIIYFVICGLAILILFLLVHQVLSHEMTKEG